MKYKLSIKDIAVCGMFGALMFASKLITELLPNIHLIGVFIVALTVCYRAKALLSVYVFVIVTGLYYGFPLWWPPYLYIWLPLWGVSMLIPKKINTKVAAFVFPIVSALHGLFYGILYAPSQALLFGLDFKGMISWIIAGLPFDLIHALSNLLAGTLILPITLALKKTNN